MRQFRAKTTKILRNSLAYMLDFLVIQMSKVNREKGYCLTVKQTDQTKNYQGSHKQKGQGYSDVRMPKIPGFPMDPISSLKFFFFFL